GRRRADRAERAAGTGRHARRHAHRHARGHAGRHQRQRSRSAAPAERRPAAAPTRSTLTTMPRTHAMPHPERSSLLSHALVLGGIATSLLSLSACGDGGGGREGGCESIIAGDLVVTEIMANPPGPDSGSEWFEIYNASPAAIG